MRLMCRGLLILLQTDHFFSSLNVIAKLPVTVPQLLSFEKCGLRYIEIHTEIDIKLFHPMKSYAMQNYFCYYVVSLVGVDSETLFTLKYFINAEEMYLFSPGNIHFTFSEYV